MIALASPVIDRASPYARLALRWWPALAALASAAMLAAAHAFENFGHYQPCALCLRQREIYWLALAVAGAGAVIWLRRPDSAGACAISAALGGVFLLSAAVAAYHAGIEWDWWPGPASCTAAGLPPAPTGDLSAPLNPVLCDEAAWRMFGLSMAGWNVLASIGLAAASLTASMSASKETDQ